jgi:hypothetical protein
MKAAHLTIIWMSALLLILPGAVQFRSHLHGTPEARTLTIGCSVFMSSVFNE